MVEFECQVCLGCLPTDGRKQMDISLNPTDLISPYTPINLFVHQDLVKKIHKCKSRDLASANIWKTTKIRIPVDKANALKATDGIQAGPPVTDPDWRLARYEPTDGEDQE